MPFPFMPVGAIVAGAILGAALTLFVWILMALDRMATRAADSVVSGLVSGFRGWTTDRARPARPAPTSPAPPADDMAEMTEGSVPVQRVHAAVR
jgi:hypothetical protein